MAKQRKAIEHTPEGIGHELPEGPVAAVQQENGIPVGGQDQPLANVDVKTGEVLAQAKGNGHAARFKSREREKEACYINPNSFDTVNTPGNRVESGKANNVKNRNGSIGAFLILMDEKPSADAIGFLKEAGYKYEKVDEREPKSALAWKKPYQHGEWNVRQEMDHRAVVDDMITEFMGGKIVQAQGVGR